VIPPDTTLVEKIKVPSLIGPIQVKAANAIMVSAFVFSASLSFADSKGLKWRREQSGALREVSVSGQDEHQVNGCKMVANPENE